LSFQSLLGKQQQGKQNKSQHVEKDGRQRNSNLDFLCAAVIRLFSG
jgi:hypothetical protein